MFSWLDICSCEQSSLDEKTPLLQSGYCHCKTGIKVFCIILGHIILLCAAISVIILNSSRSSSPYGSGSTKLRWISCGQLQCANLTVPLNYHNTSIGNAHIAVVKYPTTSKQKIGTIIFNPGGPGGSGTGSIYRIGNIIRNITDAAFDVISFDPRGVNMTAPKVRCITDFDRRRALQDVIASTAPSINIHDIGIWDSFAQLVAGKCEENTCVALSYMSTPSVARDLARLVDLLREQGGKDISYWGFSYGTNLGAIFAAMFPNKLNKIILDGIRSPLDSRDIFEWGSTSIASQDDVVEGYFSICDKVGPARCALSGQSKGKIKSLMDRLYDRPLTHSGDGDIQIITFYAYKSYFYEVLYRPWKWPSFANITLDLMHGDTNSFVAVATPDRASFEQFDSSLAVLCTDALPASYSLESWKDYVLNMTHRSFIAGDSRSLDTLPCRHWLREPSERWLGDYDNISFDTPILAIGNTFDPATPIDSARRLVDAMNLKSGNNAVLLEQNSYGHCSTSTYSTCTHQTILDYLQEGILPRKGTVCEIDSGDHDDYFPKAPRSDHHF